MATCFELILKGVSNDVFHVLELTLQILELFVVVSDDVLVLQILVLQLLSLTLNGLQLSTEFFG